ncbi:MAG: xanthine dehydrogenase small subunit [Bacteroidia bacterium]|nr:xanthine dehydrogenase small subunit [Bacteroidia bacterium]
MNHNKIAFVLDGKVTEIGFRNSPYYPTTTLLQYLRSLPGHKGTKEGCNEGDCGACTVVIAEPDGSNKLKYNAFNSCLIFLPQIHGKYVITVENLGTPQNPHIIQKALVDRHGSQCGYCTPGIVMSAFALYKQCKTPGYEEILDALAGNLCRCTGYLPVIDAIKEACRFNGKDHFNAEEPEIIRMLKNIRNNTSKTIKIEKNECCYYILADIKQIWSILNNSKEHYTIVSGNTDTVLRVNKKHESLNRLIDISNVQQLKKIDIKKDYIIIGSAACIEDIKSAVKNIFPPFYNILKIFGSRQVRNQATLGGNVASASPIGDTLPVLMAYDAEVILQSQNHTREINIRNFITGYRTTQIKYDEIIAGIKIPKLPPEKIVTAYKISKRRDLDISTVNVAFCLELFQNNIVKQIELFYGGMSAWTKRAVNTEKFLTGKQWTRENVEQAMNFIEEDFTPISDARSGAPGRSIMAKNLLLKFWNDVKKCN